ncbi:amiloride-sensitive sodium channel subunit beta [Caerostris extrusa]|uniref:Amiloride-sensitive sodium channel subunit beta n=1 Tax=Caerostris extrusa TaxID=172846 RepID=A0AAV4TI04_CAEEX|nr:amiloride-sensitive sodium channel subunit beta [Caerostris extrusa]
MGKRFEYDVISDKSYRFQHSSSQSYNFLYYRLQHKYVLIKRVEIELADLSPKDVEVFSITQAASSKNGRDSTHCTHSNLPPVCISLKEKTRCLKDPLCYWSWFEDTCYCNRNPCDTLYCYPDLNKSDEVCACSMLLCQWNGTNEACFMAQDYTGGVTCLCKYSFDYPLKRLHRSKEPCKGQCEPSNDVRDVERFFIPSIEVTSDYGMPFDNLILSCSYGPEPCKDMVTLYSPTYGKCYMFNYVGNFNDKDTPPVKIVKQAGRMHGLQLYLQARRNDTLPLLTRDLGIRPTLGICAQDGQVLVNNYSGDPYVQSECESFCINQEIFKRCGLLPSTLFTCCGDTGEKVICVTNSTEDSCFMSVVHDTDSGTVDCDCPPPCREITYELTTSASQLNPDFFLHGKKAKSLKTENGQATVTNAEFEYGLCFSKKSIVLQT